MIKKYSKESDTPYATVEKWVYQRKESNAKNGVTDKLPKTQTKTEVKKQISEIALEITAGHVSDDHVKQVGDALAGAISASHKIKNPKVWFILSDNQN